MHSNRTERRISEAEPDQGSAHLEGDHDFLVGGGEMAALVREKDWSQTPLGPIETWPQSLRTAASLCLASNFPINLIWGPEHIQIYNDGYRVVCGEAHPAALGQGYDVTWASAWPEIGEPFARALRGETSFIENQRMFLTRNGYLEETFFTFSLSPIRDESGRIGGVFHPVAETTRAMLSERRLRALRELSASLAGAADLAEMAQMTVDTLHGLEFSLPFVLFYILDAHGERYQLAAHCGVAIGSGASPAEIGIEASMPWPIAEAVRAAGILECVGVRARLDGFPCGPYDEAPDAAFVAPIRASGCERPPAIVIFGVSTRLPIDDAYRGLYELLAASISSALGVVRAREDERRRAESLAEIDRAKTMFFSNVSHEFRTPLTLMLGPIEEALAERDLSAAQRERLSIAHRNAQRLRKLVDSLLDFSRIEAGRVNAQFAPTDLAALTADLASNFRSACERAGLRLLVDCPPLSQPVHVDREMWEKIVLNLLSNAFKFTLSGGIEVALRETATGAELVVRDSGVGIPAAELPRLFERFHRIEGQRGRSYEGSGIGLSMVRELVRLHGGTIAAESIEGAGTTFRLAVPFGAGHLPIDQIQPSATTPLPVGRSDAFVDEALQWLPDARDDEPARSGPAIGASGPRARGRIVVAEDNADMRNYVRQILSDDGYEVEAVANGAAALVAARKNPMPDLVLTDVMMPDFDGFALLDALRADPNLAGVSVIMLSARAGEEARVEGLVKGADDYLIKPFSARELRARIDSAVRLGQQRRAAAERDQAANIELERRVVERTAELRQVNARLETALIELDGAMQALARSEAEFRASFEEAVVGKVMVEPDTRRIVRANRAFADMLGYRPDELIGRTGVEITWREDRDADEFELTRHLAGESAGYFIEKRYMRRDGAPFWVRASARLVNVANHGDRTRLIFATIENIDARRRAEDALHATQSALAKSEAEFRASFEGAAVGKALVEPVSMRILRANRAFANMLGYEPEEIVGHTGAEYTPSEDIEADARAYSRLRWGEANVFFREKRYLRRNCAPFWARVSVSLVDVPDHSDHPRLVVATIEDIDAKHNAEDSLRAAKHDLEVVVDQRTAALGQRDILLREVYHRVKNNLQIVDGMLMMQARKLGSQRAKQALLSMRGRVQALGLVHQQLMGSADLKTFDIAPFLVELSNNILSGHASVGVNLHVDAAPMAVGFDLAIPLGMLVNELVTNSLKHAFAAQGGNITVALRPDAQGTLVLVVSDDGRGQGASVAKRSNSGLGTTIVEGLVAQIGGTMLVRYDKGTTTEIRTRMRAPK